MDKPSLNLTEYLRYFLAGAVAIISYLFLHPATFKELDIANETLASIPLVLISFVFGSLIYSIHRALLYPFFYWVMLSFSCKKMMDKDFERWDQRRDKKSFSSRMEEWASQVHFLYCSGWAVLIAILSPNFSASCYGISTKRLCFILIIWLILMVGALVHHYRFLCFDSKTKEYEKKYPLNKEKAPE